MAHSCVPNFQTGRPNKEVKYRDYDESEYAAMAAVNLISSARVVHKLDTVFTEYSAQYLLDYAERGEDGKLTVKDALKFALKNGIPKKEDWKCLQCIFKRPFPSSYVPPLVSVKGELIEPKNLEEMFKFLVQSPIGARLHMFTPELDRLGDGIYAGPRGNGTSYVGLRDVIICEIKEIGETPVATVKICYKQMESFIDVALDAMFVEIPKNGSGDSRITEPTGLLVDFCFLRLSIK